MEISHRVHSYYILPVAGICVQEVRFGCKNRRIFHKHSGQVQDTVWSVGIETWVLVSTDELFLGQNEAIELDAVETLLV